MFFVMNQNHHTTMVVNLIEIVLYAIDINEKTRAVSVFGGISFLHGTQHSIIRGPKSHRLRFVHIGISY